MRDYSQIGVTVLIKYYTEEEKEKDEQRYSTNYKNKMHFKLT